MSIHIIERGKRGTIIGNTVNKLLGFFGKAPVARPSGAAQAAVTATSTNGTAAAAADLNALKAEAELIGDDVRAAIVLTNKLRADLVELGLIKGGA
jgi:hypothetical protein